MMGMVSTSEVPVNFNETTWHKVPEDSHCQNDRVTLKLIKMLFTVVLQNHSRVPNTVCYRFLPWQFWLWVCITSVCWKVIGLLVTCNEVIHSTLEQLSRLFDFSELMLFHHPHFYLAVCSSSLSENHSFLLSVLIFLQSSVDSLAAEIIFTSDPKHLFS
jgi:hypothetical protein